MLLIFSVHFFAVLTLAKAAGALPSGPLQNRRRGTFLTVGCKGNYDAAMFARLDRLCDDCYNLYRAMTMYSLCTQDCFTSQEFKGCVDVLQENGNVNLFQTYIKQLHGADISALVGPWNTSTVGIVSTGTVSTDSTGTVGTGTVSTGTVGKGTIGTGTIGTGTMGTSTMGTGTMGTGTMGTGTVGTGTMRTGTMDEGTIGTSTMGTGTTGAVATGTVRSSQVPRNQSGSTSGSLFSSIFSPELQAS